MSLSNTLLNPMAPLLKMWLKIAVALTFFLLEGDALPSGCQKPNDLRKLTCIEPNIDEILNYLVETRDARFIDISIIGCKSDETRGKVTLNSTMFDGHPDLLKLTVRLCEIKRINPGTFKSLKKLRFLDLSGNDLGWRALFQQEFSGLEQLETLNLDYNNLHTAILRTNTFTGLPALGKLSLNGNHLHSFVPVLSQSNIGLILSNNWLETATLSGGSQTNVCLVDYTKSGITSLNMDNLKNIKCNDPDGVSLIFAWNAFTSFDANMFAGFGSFNELDFSGVTMQPTLIKNFTAAIKGRNVSTLRLARTQWARENLDVLKESAIEYLDLSNNIITFSGAAETRSLSNLKSVQFLDLSFNDVVSSLRFEIPMPNLRYLDLTGLTIPVTPASLSFQTNLALQNLETLILSRAFIGECPVPRKDFSAIPSWFSGLYNLKELYLDNNMRLFRCLSDKYYLGFFKGLTNLQNLSLSWTDFGEMDPAMTGYANIFADQANTIRYLNFVGGFITHRHISAGLIKNLRYLTNLNFGKNSIGYLFSEWFENLDNLKLLNLQDNKITTVVGADGRFFPQSLSQLSIGNNAFACDCQLRLFAEWLHGLDDSQMWVTDMDKAVCLTPIEYYDENERIADFYKSKFVCRHGIAFTSAAAALLLIIFTLSLGCYCRHDIKYMMAMRRLHRAGGRGDRRPLLPRGSVKLIYDVRDDTDRQWINMNIGHITDCRDFNITVNHPDDIQVPGEERRNPLSQQIRDFRNQCYYTLLFVSNHFKDDLWPEVHANLSLQEIHNIRFILVLIEDLRLRDLPRELKALAKQRPCFKWPTERNDECCGGSLRRRRQLFWRQLILALLPRH